jgi:hypothetical protein
VVSMGGLGVAAFITYHASLTNPSVVQVYVKSAKVMSDFTSVYDRTFLHRSARSMVEASSLPAGVVDIPRFRSILMLSWNINHIHSILLQCTGDATPS